MAHPLFGPEIRDMLHNGDRAGLAALCDELHPATIAETIEGDFAPDEIWEVISQSEIRTQAAIFEYLPVTVQEAMVEDTKRPQVGPQMCPLQRQRSFAGSTEDSAGASG